METTTIRVHRATQEKLKKLSIAEHITITELVGKIVASHEKSFWKGFEDEAVAFMGKEELKARRGFDGVLRDGLAR